MKGTTKLAIGAAVGLAAVGVAVLAMGSSKSATGGGGGNPPPAPPPPVAGTISLVQGSAYSLRVFKTTMDTATLTNALNNLGFAGATVSANSDGTFDVGGTWPNADTTLQAQQSGFAFDPTF